MTSIKLKQYYDSLKIQDKPLPVDKRKTPWPTIKKLKLSLGVKPVGTWLEFYTALLYDMRVRFYHKVHKAVFG